MNKRLSIIPIILLAGCSTFKEWVCKDDAVDVGAISNPVTLSLSDQRPLDLSKYKDVGFEIIKKSDGTFLVGIPLKAFKEQQELLIELYNRIDANQTYILEYKKFYEEANKP